MEAKCHKCLYRSSPVTGTLCEHCKDISSKAQVSHFKLDPKIRKIKD